MNQEQREMLLAELIGGERSEDDPEVQAVLNAHPELGAALARRRSFAGILTAAGRELRADLAAADPSPQSAEIVRREVESFARERNAEGRHDAASPPGSGTVHRGWFVAGAVAAAAAAVLLFVLLSSNGADSPTGGNEPGTRYMEGRSKLQELAATRDVPVGESVTWDLSRFGFEADDAIQIDIHTNPDAMFSDDEGVVSIPLGVLRTWTSPADLFTVSDGATASFKLYRRVDRELELVGQQVLRLQR